MNNHLNEDQITEWVLGARDEFARRHLETCEACSGEAKELHRTISSFRDSIHATAQRDRSFWRNQQLALREQLSARDWYPLHWAWAAAMVMVLIAAVFLTRAPNSPRNYASEDADKALLQEVQGDLNREVPEALAPAVLIAEERNEILTNKGGSADLLSRSAAFESTSFSSAGPPPDRQMTHSQAADLKSRSALSLKLKKRREMK